MLTNAEGIALIKKYEGCKLKAYTCPAGVLTIGYGHTGKDITPGTRITETRAHELLMKDIATAEKGALSNVTDPINDNELSAMVSFTFNLGVASLARSTLLRLFNEGNHEGAAEQFLRWVMAGGKELDGLRKRRAAERALFLKKPALMVR